MTINKSKGQSLKTTGLFLSRPCFSHGQLYVGCSRGGSPANLFIMAPENKTKFEYFVTNESLLQKSVMLIKLFSDLLSNTI